jgi:hypothetical protein
MALQKTSKTVEKVVEQEDLLDCCIAETEKKKPAAVVVDKSTTLKLNIKVEELCCGVWQHAGIVKVDVKVNSKGEFLIPTSILNPDPKELYRRVGSITGKIE